MHVSAYEGPDLRGLCAPKQLNNLPTTGSLFPLLTLAVPASLTNNVSPANAALIISFI